MPDAQNEYFKDLGAMQRAKHELLKRYLEAWFPIMTSRSNAIIYTDTHAGRGRHLSGDAGSPLVALHAFLGHKAYRRMIAQTRVSFFYIEKDEDNCKALEEELSAIQLPDTKNLKVKVFQANSYEALASTLDAIHTKGTRVKPGFFFLDPFGFKIPGDLIKDILSFSHTEVLLNVMWRYVHMGIARAPTLPGMQETMNALFVGNGWQEILNSSEPFARKADLALDKLKLGYGAKYATSLKMVPRKGGIKYFLAHFTNHPLGVNKMKHAIWALTDTQRFVWRESESGYQATLFHQPGVIVQARKWTLEVLSNEWMTIRELRDKQLQSPWKDTHVNQALKALWKQHQLEVDPGQQREKTLIIKKLKRIRRAPSKPQE